MRSHHVSPTVTVSDGYLKSIEEEARRMTRWAYLRRNRREPPLFQTEMNCESRRAWAYLDDKFWRRPVGVISFDADPVGVYEGIGPGFLGPDLAVGHFLSCGVSTHIDPRSIAFIFELPRRPYGWLTEEMAKVYDHDGYLIPDDYVEEPHKWT